MQNSTVTLELDSRPVKETSNRRELVKGVLGISISKEVIDRKHITARSIE